MVVADYDSPLSKIFWTLLQRPFLIVFNGMLSLEGSVNSMWLGRWQKTQKCCSLPSFLFMIMSLMFCFIPFISFVEKKTNEINHEIVPIWLFLFISFIFFIMLKDMYQYREFCFLTSNFVYYGWVLCLVHVYVASEFLVPRRRYV